MDIYVNEPCTVAGITLVDTRIAMGNATPMTVPIPGRRTVLAAKRVLFSGSGATVGIWEGGPGEVLIESYPVDELWRIIDGSVLFTDSGGHSRAFGPGDTFVLHRGFSGVARLPVSMRKLYASLAVSGT